MSLDQGAKRDDAVSGRSSGAATQIARMRAAIDRAVAVGPDFLRGDVDADHMANTMVAAVRAYASEARANGSGDRPQSAEARALQGVLAELAGCGSGYLAGRCDAACVARTMTQIVREFGAQGAA